MEDIVVIIVLKVFNSDSSYMFFRRRNVQVTFEEKLQLYQIHT